MSRKYPFNTLLRRRDFLLGLLALTTVATSSRQTVSYPRFSDYPFCLGVASGEPLPDSIVIWTRLACKIPNIAIAVHWVICRDETMKQVVKKGTIKAIPEYAHSVHVVVNGLEPSRCYWYQFKAGTEVSPIGRTFSAPEFNLSLERLKFAFVSCQNYEEGYFNAYRHLASEDVNFVLHLGDYIYEDAGNPSSHHPRQHPSVEATDLTTYRNRYALYKSDPDLQATHAAFPFICTWDDHEVDNDYANGFSSDFQDLTRFIIRRAAAYQAYYEHTPLRPSSQPHGSYLKLYRRFKFGDLAEFNILDTRQYRSKQACSSKYYGGGQLITNCSERFDPRRTMLGDKQENWLIAGLENSQSIWKAIAQQYLVAELREKSGSLEAYWSDSWSGYPVSRRKILEFIERKSLSNPVFLGGDIHSFWVTDLMVDFHKPDSKVVATEFVGTSISSKGIPYEQFAAYLPDNPHIKFFESRLRGYVKCSLDRKQWLSELKVVDTVSHRESNISTLATYIVENGRAGAKKL